MATIRWLLVVLVAVVLEGCCSFNNNPHRLSGALIAWDGLGADPTRPVRQPKRFVKSANSEPVASDVTGALGSPGAADLDAQDTVVDYRRVAQALVICVACLPADVPKADMTSAYLSLRRARLVKKMLGNWRPGQSPKPVIIAR